MFENRYHSISNDNHEGIIIIKPFGMWRKGGRIKLIFPPLTNLNCVQNQPDKEPRLHKRANAQHKCCLGVLHGMLVSYPVLQTNSELFHTPSTIQLMFLLFNIHSFKRGLHRLRMRGAGMKSEAVDCTLLSLYTTKA